jgi:hypothetical protein
MSDYAQIVTLVEGKTEQIFIQDIVSPYLAGKGIYITPIIISKPGQKGGDVKFARVKNDIELHLKQRPDTYLTLFIDYYGLKKDWPGFEEAKNQSTPSGKAEKINTATKNQVNNLFGNNDAERRFIPYVAMYEFEAMLFSEPQELAAQLQVPQSRIDKILSDCGGEPENIDDSPLTAPSRRIEALSPRFKKTSTGIAIAKAIGLEKIRSHCALFNNWLTNIESLEGRKHG